MLKAAAAIAMLASLAFADLAIANTGSQPIETAQSPVVLAWVIIVASLFFALGFGIVVANVRSRFVVGLPTLLKTGVSIVVVWIAWPFINRVIGVAMIVVAGIVHMRLPSLPTPDDVDGMVEVADAAFDALQIGLVAGLAYVLAGRRLIAAWRAASARRRQEFGSPKPETPDAHPAQDDLAYKPKQ